MQSCPCQSPWFYAAFALALAASAFAGYRFARRRGRPIADRLQALVDERTNTLEQLNQDLQRLTTTDALTGVANRRQFDETIEREWRRAWRARTPISCIMIDIDHFKAFNDRYGHVQGDACLTQIAATLSTVVRRAGDLIARYGGEEFAVVMPATSLEGARAVAETLRGRVESLRLPHGASATAPYVTISLGVGSRVPARGQSPSTLVAVADRALYRAKHAGRNKVETE